MAWCWFGELIDVLDLVSLSEGQQQQQQQQAKDTPCPTSCKQLWLLLKDQRPRRGFKRLCSYCGHAAMQLLWECSRAAAADMRPCSSSRRGHAALPATRPQWKCGFRSPVVFQQPQAHYSTHPLGVWGTRPAPTLLAGTPGAQPGARPGLGEN